MIKPNKLKAGDTIATVSLSWGGAGDEGLRHKYELGKSRIEKTLGLKIIEMPNSLKGSDYLAKNPKARADDMMEAFSNKEIKGIFTNIGGDDTIKLLQYIDYGIIKKNPKIFLGYSDTTINHLMCYKSGLTSFYGPSLLIEFAENGKMHDYTIKSLKDNIFSSSPIGKVSPSNNWTSEWLPWDKEENNYLYRKMKNERHGYELLQGKGIVQGELLGGCLEVLNDITKTELWPCNEEWKNKILFLETSHEKPSPELIRDFFNKLGETGILNLINGIIFGKPNEEAFYDEYKAEIIGIVKNKYNLDNLPVLYNMNFGHNAPMLTLPYGIKAEIDCDEKKFSIIESGVK